MNIWSTIHNSVFEVFENTATKCLQSFDTMQLCVWIQYIKRTCCLYLQGQNNIKMISHTGRMQGRSSKLTKMTAAILRTHQHPPLHSFHPQPVTVKRKAVPLQTWSGPERSRKLRFPDFMTTVQDDGKVVSLSNWPSIPPGNAPGTHFCQRLSRPQGHSAIRRILCQ